MTMPSTPDFLNLTNAVFTGSLPSGWSFLIPPSDPRASDSARSSDDPQSQAQDLVYTAHVSLGRTEMQIGRKQVSLTPGMAVTVEIRTGQRRVIQYLLSPLLRYRQEAMRER